LKNATDTGYFHALFIFFHVEENEPKEDARIPLNPARRRGGRSVRKLARLRQGYGWLRQSARFILSASPMLGAGQRESNQKVKNVIKPSQSLI